jgi:hypothetical protein
MTSSVMKTSDLSSSHAADSCSAWCDAQGWAWVARPPQNSSQQKHEKPGEGATEKNGHGTNQNLFFLCGCSI